MSCISASSRDGCQKCSLLLDRCHARCMIRLEGGCSLAHMGACLLRQRSMAAHGSFWIATLNRISKRSAGEILSCLIATGIERNPASEAITRNSRRSLNIQVEILCVGDVKELQPHDAAWNPCSRANDAIHDDGVASAAVLDGLRAGVAIVEE